MLNISKFVGGLTLGVVLAFASAFVADQLVVTKPLAASVYKVAGLAVASPAQAADATAPAGDAAAPAATAEAAPAAEAALEPVGPLLAKANVANGEKLAKVCATCHTFVKDGPNKVGPNLYGIVGNHRAHLGDGYAYSAAMKAQSGDKWDYETLNKYLNKPKDVVPGTKMAFAGIKKASDRADVIAYLRTLADTPVALP